MMRLALIAALVFAVPALAGTPVTLKADVVDADGIVTLGDIFDGAGPAGRTPLATRTGTSVMLAASTVQAAARRAGLDWANAEGLGQIVVTSLPTAASTTRPPAAGRANVDVLVWARGLAVGEVVQPQDLIWGKAALAPADAPNDPDAVIGQAARRPLRAGAAIGARDVSAPQVVRANEVVTLTYENGGVSLSLRGKALSGGGVGDAINVLNVTSKKTIQAVVSGPGQALVGPGAEALQLNRSTRYAAR